MKKILLCIDLQKEFSNSGEYQKVLNYIKENKEQYDMVIGTIFCNYPESRFIRDLEWTGCMNVNDSSIEYDVDCLLYKNTYVAKIDEYINKEDEIYIIGCDSDACVMATLFYLFDNDYKFFVLKDYVYTTSTKFTDYDVEKILKRNFGKLCI